MIRESNWHWGDCPTLVIAYSYCYMETLELWPYIGQSSFSTPLKTSLSFIISQKCSHTPTHSIFGAQLAGNYRKSVMCDLVCIFHWTHFHVKILQQLHLYGCMAWIELRNGKRWTSKYFFSTVEMFCLCTHGNLHGKLYHLAKIEKLTCS